MSRLQPKSFFLGVGAEELCVLDQAGLGTAVCLPLAAYLPTTMAATGFDWVPPLETVLALLGVSDQGNLVVTLSDHWVRYFMLSVPDGVKSLAELRALALVRFEKLFGHPADGWWIEADWKPQGAILASAIPVGVLDALKTIGASGRWRIRSVQTYALRLAQHFHTVVPADCWLCCRTHMAMTAFLVEGGGISYVRYFTNMSVPPSLAIGELLEAESLRFGKALPDKLCLVGDTNGFADGERVRTMKVTLQQTAKLPWALSSEAARVAAQGVFS